MTKIHPLEVIDYDLISYWLNLIPEYIRTPYHTAIHRTSIEPRYDEFHRPLPNLTLLTGGIQSGKTVAGWTHMFAMHWCSKILWIVGERYEDCRYEFKGVVEKAVQVGALDWKNVTFPQNPGPCRALFNNGCILRTLSSADASTLASESPDGVLMVEAGRQSWMAFETLWQRVIQKTGWLIVSGTIESLQGRWFPNLWNELQGDNIYHGKSLRLPTYANPSLYPEGERDPKIIAARNTMSEEEFAERFLGIPRAPAGVVFPEFRRVTHVRNSAEYDRMYPVRLWVDPGYYPSSYAVLFVQIIGDQIRIFDELYLTSMDNDTVIGMALNHHTYTNWERVVIDVAAQAHAGAQEPAADTWRRKLAGRNVPVVAKFVKVHAGIIRTHDKLRINHMTNQPYLIIHPRCTHTIWEFEEGYRFHIRKEGEIAGDTPIDKNNHSSKAAAYGIIDMYGIAEGVLGPPLRPTRKKMIYDYQTR